MFMTWVLIIAVVAFYLIGILVYVDSYTTKDIKVHPNGGFLGMPFITSSNRDTTPKDIRKALFWPIFFLFTVIKSFLFIIHEFFSGVCLLFGFYYKRTVTYKLIDKFLDI